MFFSLQFINDWPIFDDIDTFGDDLINTVSNTRAYVHEICPPEVIMKILRKEKNYCLLAKFTSVIPQSVRNFEYIE